MGRLDDVLAGREQLVRLQDDVRAARLGGLLARLQVRLVDAQDAHELDAVDGVHDAVELALVERAAERPAAPGAGRVAADERVQVRVERVRDVLLDARGVRHRARLEVDHDRQAAIPARLELDLRADQAPLVEVLGDLGQQVLVRHQLLVGQAPVGRVDARHEVQRHGAAGRGRDADRAGDARARLAGHELEVLRGHRAIARADLHRRALARVADDLGVHAARRGLRVRHGVDARDRALEHGQRLGRHIAVAPAAVAVAREAHDRALGRHGTVLRPAAVGLADRGPELDFAGYEVDHEVAVELGRADEVVARLPARPVPGLRVLDLERLPRAELEDRLVAQRVDLAGRAVRDADDLAVDARGVRGRQAGGPPRRRGPGEVRGGGVGPRRGARGR